MPARSLKEATRMGLDLVRIRPSVGPEKMTRGLPEGPWDPTKIPRIQNLMSGVEFLLGMGGVA